MRSAPLGPRRRALASALLLVLAGTGLGAGAPREQAPGPAVALASVCATCHSNAPRAEALRDAEGAAIGPHDLWRGSVHSAAAVDPIWRATLAAELAAYPARAAATAETCQRCHAPVADALGLDDHGTGDPLHALTCDGDLGLAARDGVSCSICHGILPDGLGSPATFDGHFRLDAERRLYGPHPEPVTPPMERMAGFTPTEGRQLLDPGLCASCHTLSTAPLDGAGQTVGGHFLEQGPFLEWTASAFADPERPVTCQACHLPTRDAGGQAHRTRIARNPGGRDFPFTRPREPFGRHEFHGGNVLLLELLAEHAVELGAPGAPADYARALERTREQLEQRTATLELIDRRAEAEATVVRLAVVNHTGHKLPTGYPARRMFLTVEVLDATGEVVFAAGRTDARGRLLDGEGQVLASELPGGPGAVHRTTIDGDGPTVQWRAEAEDLDGSPAFRLLAMARWGVDDRILPRGWSADRPGGAETQPAGVEGDSDFLPGRDGVELRLHPSVVARGTRLVARLRYQPYAPRWLAELLASETAASARLVELLGDRPLPDVELARLELRLP